MSKETTTETISREEALRKVAEVLEEALAEYEALEKMDLEMAEDPSRPMIQDDAAASADAAEAEPAEAEEEDKEESEAKEKDEDKEEDEEEEEMSDDALKSEYAAVASEMERRGLIQKTQSQQTEQSTQSTQTSTSSESELRKAMEGEIDELRKTIASLTETVSKIASQPATRKGVSGLAPLRKSEEGEEKSLRKSEIVEKLLELKKSGDRRVNTALINRVETSRMNPEDLNFIKGILG